jgi:hypothetical protein
MNWRNPGGGFCHQLSTIVRDGKNIAVSAGGGSGINSIMLGANGGSGCVTKGIEKNCATVKVLGGDSIHISETQTFSIKTVNHHVIYDINRVSYRLSGLDSCSVVYEYYGCSSDSLKVQFGGEIVSQPYCSLKRFSNE